MIDLAQVWTRLWAVWDDVWPAALGSIHNNRAGGEVASGQKKAVVEATAHSSSFLHSLHVWRGTQKQRQKRSWKFGMRERNMNVENVCTARSAKWRNAPRSTIHTPGKTEREQQMPHNSTRELQQAMSCARRFGKQIIAAFFLSYYEGITRGRWRLHRFFGSTLLSLSRLGGYSIRVICLSAGLFNSIDRFFKKLSLWIATSPQSVSIFSFEI